MARQVGPLKIVGRIENFCCYKMQGEYYIRMESSLTGRRFWTSKAFEGSGKSCGLLALASPLASKLYSTLPKERKGRSVFQKLTGKVKLLLKEGYDEEKIRHWFLKNYINDHREGKRRSTRESLHSKNDSTHVLKTMPRLIAYPSLPSLTRQKKHTIGRCGCSSVP